MSRPGPIDGSAEGLALVGALVGLADRGRVPRCAERVGSGLWLSECPEERETAAAWCAGCVVLAECAAAARAYRVNFGVWGGRDHTRRGRYVAGRP